jgi:Xaa-Pro aminopeptidase
MKLERTIFQERLARVERMLAEDDLAGLAVYATGSALGPSSRTHGYMRYLCDWDSHHAPSLLLLVFGHPPTLLVPNIFMTFLGKQYHWIEDVRFVKLTDFAHVAAQVVAERGLGAGRLGLVGRNEMPAPVWEGFTERLPRVEWHDVTTVLDRLRVIKDPAQLVMHERAAEICDEMFATLAREIHTPKPAFQLQADMERTARYAGCEYCMTWLTAMPKADYSRFFKEECRRVPQQGDQVFAGIYLIYEGHWGHAIRGGTLGPPSPEQRHIYDVALEMERAMLDRLTPGQDLHAVQAAAERVVNDHYPDGKAEGIFRFRHGHALGLSYEDPVASAAFPQLYDAPPASRTALEVTAGMLFELHPNLFVPDVAGGVVGDMVAVTEQGPQLLNAYPRELIEW